MSENSSGARPTSLLQRFSLDYLLERLENIFPLMLGLLIGAMLVQMLGRLPHKWAVFIGLGTVVFSVMVLIVTLTTFTRNVLLFSAIFVLPLAYNITFGYRDNVRFEVLSNGYPIDLFDVLISPLVLGWFYQIWIKPTPIAIHFPRAALAVMGIMFAMCLYSTLFVARETFFAYSMMFTQMKCYFFALFIANYVRSPKYFRVIGYAFAAVLLTQGIIVAEQLFLGVIFTAELLGRQTELRAASGMTTLLRVSGTLGHPNAMAMYLDLLIPWVAFQLVTENKIKRKIFLAAALLLGGFAVISSGSRSGWLGMIVGAGLSMTLWYRKQRKNPILAMISIAVGGAIVFTTLFFTSHTFRARLTEDDRGAAEVRIPLMAVAKEMIASNPIKGVGLANYTHEMLLYDRTNDFIASNYSMPVHNTFLMLAAEIGIPGAAVFVILLLIFIRESHRIAMQGNRETSALGFGMLASLIGWMIHNQSNQTAPFADTTLWILFGLIAAARSDILRSRNNPNLAPETQQG